MVAQKIVLSQEMKLFFQLFAKFWPFSLVLDCDSNWSGRSHKREVQLRTERANTFGRKCHWKFITLRMMMMIGIQISSSSSMINILNAIITINAIIIMKVMMITVNCTILIIPPISSLVNCNQCGRVHVGRLMWSSLPWSLSSWSCLLWRPLSWPSSPSL